MRISVQVLVILVIFGNITSCLHFGCQSETHFDENAQLSKLKQQQDLFEKTINGLIVNIKDVEAKVQATNNTNDKVIILEKAVLSERQKIYNLQNEIVPAFNLSKNSCRQLTNNQKLNLLQELKKARQQLKKLKDISNKIQSNPQVTQIQKDISKQQTIIGSIDKAIHSQCQNKTVLTATIFQSNLIATNWILGKQTINDIVNQYYRRSRQYHNVTNCPIHTPFFNGQQCIKCSKDSPIFNMYTEKCDKCPPDTTVNTQKRTCDQIPHVCNYDHAINYALDGASELPKNPKNLSSCPSTRPYYSTQDGCIKCHLPSYWSVKDNKCKDCQAGKVFQLNLKKCSTPHNNTISYLGGKSRWVTGKGNLTNVLKARADLLKSSKTHLTTCTRHTPYFDGIKCISCPNQFSFKQRKCVAPPTGMVYDHNLHEYVKAEPGKQTNPKAPNMIGSANPNTNNSCDIKTPYFDGIKCISCPSPFSLFDLKSKKCVQCQPQKIYDNTTHSCVNRKTLYISTNFTNLLATKKVSLADFKAQLYNKTKQSGDSIVRKCPPAQHSNYTHCFQCPKGERFNMETKKCGSCNGTVNTVTLICQPLKTMLTNLNASNLVFGPNKDMKSYADLQKTISGPVSTCPKDKPYASSDGLKCMECKTNDSIYYDMQSKNCTKPPKDLFYDSKNHVFNKAINISNMDHLLNYIQRDNYTKTNIKKQLEELSKTRKTIVCPKDKALASPDGSSCITCQDNGYIDLKSMACIKGRRDSNIDALSKSSKVLQLGKSTLKSLDAQQKKHKGQIPTATCPAQRPLYNGTKCIGCAIDQYYNLQSMKCYSPKLVSNVKVLNSSKRVVEVDAATLDNLQKNINSSQLPTIKCSQKQPFFNNKHCISCPEGTYYNLKDLNCYTPKMVSNHKALGKSNYIEFGSHTLKNIQEDTRSSIMPTKSCPDDKPLFNGTKCISCPAQTYYNLKSLKCIRQHNVTNIQQLNKTKHYIEHGQYTLQKIQKKIAASKVPTKRCPDNTPLYNGSSCIACKPDEYYKLDTLICYKPVHCVNIDALNKTNRVLQLDNHTLAKLAQKIKKQKYPTKPCPAQTPFLSGQKCISCHKSQYYNLKTRRCYKPRFATNISSLQKAKNYVEVGNHTFANLKANLSKNPYPTVQCPQKGPIWNGKMCLGCPPGSFYLLDTFNCYVPPNVTNIAALNKTKLYIQSSKVTLKSLDAQIKKQVMPVKTCDEKTPLQNGTQCMGCNKGQYYNLQNRTCITPNMISNTDAIELSNNYLLTKKGTIQSIKDKNAKVASPKKECPTATPLFNGTACISCSNSLYSLQSLKCVSCAGDYTYDKKNHSCVELPNYYPNLANNQWIITNDTGLKDLETLTKQRKGLHNAIKCPNDSPHFNNKTKNCQICSKSKYFNYQSHSCVNCETGLEVDVNTRRCDKRLVGKYQTSLTSVNLLFQGKSKAEFQDEYDSNKNKYPKIKDCPDDKPYFDGFDCISCPSGNPYFTMVKKLCTNCPEGSSYEASEKQCRDKKGGLKSSDPNTKKMLSSIF